MAIHLQLDHVMTYTNAARLEEVLEDFRRAGFVPHDRTFRHEPGLRNGTIFLGAQYVELCWVEDPEAFQKGDPLGHELTEDPRICGVAFGSPDLQALRRGCAERGILLPEPWSAGERGVAPGPPAWTFQEIPGRLMPGASCFALSYHVALPPVRVGPNTVHALAGLTFVAQDPRARAEAWGRILGQAPLDEPRLQLGDHFVEWLSPAGFEARFGERWRPAAHPLGEAAVVHVLAESLEEARRCMTGADRPTRLAQGPDGQNELLCPAVPRDGLFFAMRQQPR